MGRKRAPQGRVTDAFTKAGQLLLARKVFVPAFWASHVMLSVIEFVQLLEMKFSAAEIQFRYAWLPATAAV